MTTIKNENLDVVRGLGIILVLFAHLGFFCLGSYSEDILIGKLIDSNEGINFSLDKFSIFVTNCNILRKIQS